MSDATTGSRVCRISPTGFGLLKKADATSVQLVWKQNAPDARIAVTRVSLEPGGVQDRHCHPGAEQTWIVESGRADVLLADGVLAVSAGDVVRTPPGQIHGLSNQGSEAFVYLTITTPPEDFATFYDAP